MGNPANPGAKAPLTVAGLRRIVVDLAAELEPDAPPDAVDALRDAASLRSFPGEEVLAMREALVRTRRIWDRPAGGAAARSAVEAMSAAKALAIAL